MKPAFYLPGMAEIRDVLPNGFKLISTFAGCGGSSLGYRRAGYRVALANEFIPAAADTYEANAHPSTIVDRRDIRKVTADSILDATGLARGQLDVFDGSPPCASFSMAGARASMWGQVKSYSDTEQRVDDLFTEYLRLLAGLRPKVAVAENVPGLTIGVARGFYNEIMEGFKAAGYVARAAILEAEWLGVPQARHRLFFVAVRDDLAEAGFKPVFPDPVPYFYSLAESLAAPRGPVETRKIGTNDVVAENVAPSIEGYAIGEEWEKIGGFGQSEKFFQLVRPDPEKPVPTLTATAAQPGSASIVHHSEKRKFSVGEMKRLCGFPDDFVLTGTYCQQVERLGRAVCPPVTMHLGRTIADRILVPYRERARAKEMA